MDMFMSCTVDTEDPKQRVTILGAPTTNTVQKRNVVIKYE